MLGSVLCSPDSVTSAHTSETYRHGPEHQVIIVKLVLVVRLCFQTVSLSSQVDVLAMECRDVGVPPPSGNFWLLISTDGVLTFITMTEIPGNNNIRTHFGSSVSGPVVRQSIAQRHMATMPFLLGLLSPAFSVWALVYGRTSPAFRVGQLPEVLSLPNGTTLE